MAKKNIVVFDFDGTITKKDTLLEFVRFVKGTSALFKGIILLFPLLIAYKLMVYPNWKVKRLFFSYFFRGMHIDDFNKYCNDFCQQSQNLIRNQAVEAISNHSKNEDIIVIISASILNWVFPFAKKLGISSVICTEVDVDEFDRLTGYFSTKNCYGIEKVNRLMNLYPQRTTYQLIVYGDSMGDKALFNIADAYFYKKFK